MFRKYRKRTTGRRKAEESVTTKPTEDKQQQEAFFQQNGKKAIRVASEKQATEAARIAALRIMEGACASIQENYSEESDSSQGKALELAQQMISDGIQNISFIREALDEIKACLSQTNFVVEATASGSKSSYHTLGRSFLNKSSKDRVWHLIEVASSQTYMSPKDGAPMGRYEFQSRPELWTAYIAELLAGLPEEPKIVTGTPIHQNFNTKVEPTESPNVPQANRDDPETETDSEQTEVRKRNFLRRMFRPKKRRKPKNRKN